MSVGTLEETKETDGGEVAQNVEPGLGCITIEVDPATMPTAKFPCWRCQIPESCKEFGKCARKG